MTDDKESAFPRFVAIFDPPRLSSYGGISLRDYFAGQALQSVVYIAVESVKNGTATNDADEKTIAAAAYRMAEALLAERAK